MVYDPIHRIEIHKITNQLESNQSKTKEKKYLIKSLEILKKKQFYTYGFIVK